MSITSPDSSAKSPSFVELLGHLNPAIAVGVQIVEAVRINYWDKLRELARQDPALRAEMPGMIVQQDKMAVYLGTTRLAIEYFGPVSVPANLADEAIKVSFIDC